MDFQSIVVEFDLAICAMIKLYNNQKGEEQMKFTTVGLDIANNVFHIVCCNEHNRIVKKKMLRRSQLLSFFSQLPVCNVAMDPISRTVIRTI